MLEKWPLLEGLHSVLISYLTFLTKTPTNVRMYLLVSINWTSNLLSLDTFHCISG